MDYVILILGLLSALIAIRGNTWNNKKKGIKKVTILGWILIAVIVLSFGLTTYSTFNRNKELSGIGNIAKGQIKIGIREILTPLEFDSFTIDNANFFAAIQDTNHLKKLFNQPILNVLYNGKRGNNFEHPYRRDSLYIDDGEKELNDAINKYHSELDEKTIEYINDILIDSFYKEKYKFVNTHLLVEDALSFFDIKTNPNWTNPPYSTYRTYYSTDDGNGHHLYNGIVSLIKKVEILYNHIKD